MRCSSTDPALWTDRKNADGKPSGASQLIVNVSPFSAV